MQITHEHCLLSLSRQLMDKVDHLRADRDAGVKAIEEVMGDVHNILEDYDHANS